MCQRVLGRDIGDPVQAAAVEVLQTQAVEVGTMRAWLADWGQSTVEPERVMGWMGRNFGNGIPPEFMPDTPAMTGCETCQYDLLLATEYA